MVRLPRISAPIQRVPSGSRFTPLPNPPPQGGRGAVRSVEEECYSAYTH